jgi:diguanylate cyclase (GGDEF)-like protein
VSASFWNAARRWLLPEVRPELRVELERRQLLGVQKHVPMIYLVAIVNLVILMAVCAHAGFSPRSYGWMGALVILSVVRTWSWTRTRPAAMPPAQVSTALRRSGGVAVVSMSAMACYATATFAFGTFQRTTIIPISLALGSMSIAHCFATVRVPSVASLALGIIPVSLAMVTLGDFEARVLGVSMMSVAVLMIRFVSVEYDHLVTEVGLQREVFDLANTDALTQVKNRRALVADVEQALAQGPGAPFALALLDLDGFKPINDRLGHLAGDELLKVVSQRLVAGSGEAATVGRLGGDEFVVVFHRVTSADDLRARVAALRAELLRPTELRGERVMVGASLGTARFPEDGASTSALLGVADAALYANKLERTRSGERVVVASARGPNRAHREA